jgi:hypothetical protein
LVAGYRYLAAVFGASKAPSTDPGWEAEGRSDSGARAAYRAAMRALLRWPARMHVKVGSVAFLRAAGTGYGIGLTDDGHRVEFLADWRDLAKLETALDGPEPVYLDVEDWQLLAIDDELRLPLPAEAMRERARFIRSALDRQR